MHVLCVYDTLVWVCVCFVRVLCYVVRVLCIVRVLFHASEVGLGDVPGLELNVCLRASEKRFAVFRVDAKCLLERRGRKQNYKRQK